MDPLGRVVRDFLKAAHEEKLLTAVSMAEELQKEGMNNGQIEEMLNGSGFEMDVVVEAINRLPVKRAKGNRNKYQSFIDAIKEPDEGSESCSGS